MPIKAVLSTTPTLSSQLSSEIRRAKAAEKQIEGFILTETTRAIGEETQLNSSLSSVISRTTIAETSLSTVISRTNIAETSLSSVITTASSEISRTTSINLRCVGLGISLLAKETALATDIATLDADLTGEISRAISIETSISQKLQSEIIRAVGIDLTLSSGLSSEIARATTADTSLSTLTSTLSTGLSSEIARATTTDTSLTSAISYIISTGGIGGSISLISELSNEIIRTTSVDIYIYRKLPSISRQDYYIISVGTNASSSYIPITYTFATPYANASKLFINLSLAYNNSSSSDVINATITEITTTGFKFNVKKIPTSSFTDTTWSNSVVAHAHITQLV